MLPYVIDLCKVRELKIEQKNRIAKLQYIFQQIKLE